MCSSTCAPCAPMVCFCSIHISDLLLCLLPSKARGFLAYAVYSFYRHGADDAEVLQPLLLASMQAESRRSVVHQPGVAAVHQRSGGGVPASIAQVCVQLPSTLFASMTPIEYQATNMPGVDK